MVASQNSLYEMLSEIVRLLVGYYSSLIPLVSLSFPIPTFCVQYSGCGLRIPGHQLRVLKPYGILSRWLNI